MNKIFYSIAAHEVGEKNIPLFFLSLKGAFRISLHMRPPQLIIEATGHHVKPVDMMCSCSPEGALERIIYVYIKKIKLKY